MIAKIGDWVNPVAGRLKDHSRDFYIAACLLLVGWSAYNVGQLRGQEAGLSVPAAATTATPTPVFRAQAVPPSTAGAGDNADKTDPRVVVSKSSSSRKYHYTWCSGAKKIKEVNRVWFATAREAEAAGYTLAGNCQP